MNKKRSIIIIITLLLFLGVLYSFYEHYIVPSYYLNALKDAHVSEIVEVGEVQYEMTKGEISFEDKNLSKLHKQKILQLIYSKTLVRRSPFLPIPEANLEEFSFALMELSATKERLATVQETDKERELVQTSLYPISFLEKILQTESSRRIFLNNGREDSQNKYYSDLEEVFAGYEEASVGFQNAFSEIIPIDTRRFVMADVILDRESIIKTFDVLKRKVSSIKNKNKKRISCISGGIFSCNKEDLQINLTLPSFSNKPSDEAINLSKEIRNLYSQVIYNNPKITEVPLIELSESRCFPGDDTPSLFIYLSPKKSGDKSKVDFVRFVGDIRFLKTDLYSGKDPFTRYFSENEVTYLPTNPFIYYKCLQNGSITSKFFLTREVSVFAIESQENGFMDNVSNEKLRKELIALEKKLVHTPYGIIREKDALEYLLKIEHLLNENLSISVINRLISLYLSAKEQRSGFVDLVRKVSLTENVNLDLLDEGVEINFEASRLFLTESDFFDFFFVSSLLTDDEIKDIFPANNIPLENQPYMYYSAIRDLPNIQKIIFNDLSFYTRIHQDVIKARFENSDIFNQ